MLIRDVELADFDAIAAITNHYIRTTAIHFAFEDVTPAELRATWSSHPNHPYLVLLDDSSTLIGYAKAGPFRDRAAYNHTAEIGIYLRHDLHARGHGKRLYSALIDRCRRQGFHSLIGGIALPNDVSVRLHESLGFRHVGVFRQVGRKFDQWHDVGFWELIFPDSR